MAEFLRGPVPGTRAGDPPSILVVEDEAVVALYLSSLLEDLSYAVCGVAATGAAALGIAEQERPALALVDIGLGGRIDGIDTACALRDRYAVPSLLMSGASDPETLARAQRAGSHGFLPKPYTAADLKAAIDRVFDADPARP